MGTKTVSPKLIAALEYGPLIGFLGVYLLFRSETFVVGATEYSGFVAVTALFIPVFLLAIGALWVLTGRLARIQIFTAGMLVIFGGLGVWMNDPRLIKMKPTAIYLCLATVLGIGLLRGQSWLKLIMEDIVPLKHKGWIILTKRVAVLFAISALANEAVWRTQSETVWVVFETVVMPILIFVFFVAQTPLIVEYATFKPVKKKR